MKALVVYGGWAGHTPKETAQVLAEALRQLNFEVEVSDTLDSFKDADKLLALDLIVPEWTMGELQKEQLKPLVAAVQAGVGIAGCHGGMGDSFRAQIQFQHMVGGQFLAHPGGKIDYRVNVTRPDDPIMEGIVDFDYHSEQYYMLVDPVNEVLATTTFAHNGAVMPVVWKKTFGKGRVFYCSLGHVAKEFTDFPLILQIMKRGMLWAAQGKPAAGQS